ncbi:hypothetical protein [Bosea sp. PAMC 26642]|uniref:hypothetical protein n=1 Tax=Bosea sp. (strain PAMC 26642) TaxID=1792307 RepID=UPI000770470A|nr:hypothetical protein [Bosea sp. PAMC 26642]AMJ62467.1 hypothetical protein AXW83_21120 [Bosea sp. PAMC 26642]
MPKLEAIPPAIRRAACAFHEAGHIVVGWHHRRAITHAWLRPPQGVSGETCFEPYRRGFQAHRAGDLRRAEIEVTILSAGQCGEMIYWNGAQGRKWYPGELRSHGDDLDQMQPFIALLQPPDAGLLREHCARAATAILYRPAMRTAQETIARRLDAASRIGADEVEAMMEEAGAQRAPLPEL